MRLTTIDQAQKYLLNFSDPKPSGDTYTIERMRELMEHLGHPQDSFKSIHVAGTSGKSSTAYFIRGMLRRAGCKVGLTVSPHVTSITERVQIGGGPLSDEVFLRYLNEFLDTLTKWPNMQPTYFELLTAFAYYVFSREEVDYAVVEVGLGGRLDATNVIGRSDKISVITPIGLDHTQVLGQTIEDIATQKAGIILPDTQVFVATQAESALETIGAICETRHASLGFATHTVSDNPLPPFQQQNLSLAVTVYDFIAERDGLLQFDGSELDEVKWQTPPGRFETRVASGKTVMLDGAHNPQKLTAFTDAYHKLARPDVTWIVALLEGPEEKLNECIRIIMRQPGHFIVTELNVGDGVNSRSSITAGHFMKLAEQFDREVTIERDPDKALKLALNGQGSDVVITGSLYLVGKLRKHLV